MATYSDERIGKTISKTWLDIQTSFSDSITFILLHICFFFFFINKLEVHINFPVSLQAPLRLLLI